IIAVYANTALTALSMPTEADFTLLGAGASLGTSPQFALDPTNSRVLRIVLGVGANFDFADAMSGTPTFGLECTAGLTGLVSFTNLPLLPFAADQIGYLVGQSTTGPRIAAQAGAVTFHDVDGNGPSTGDYISV